MNTITRIRDDVLHPALDGQAHNEHQRHLLHNTTPEVDSLVEHIVQLREYGVSQDRLRQLLVIVADLLHSNDLEAGCHKQVAQAADDLLDRLARSHAAGDTVQGEISIRSIKARLGGPGGPLATLANPAGCDSATIVRARAAVDEVLRRATADTLRSPTLRNQLGASRTDLLLSLSTDRGRATR